MVVRRPAKIIGYYINVPFAPLPHMSDISKKKNNVYIGHNEYEFVLPRGCVFEIISNHIDFTGGRRLIHLKLVKQLRESIKDQVIANKVARLSKKADKENAKKVKLENAIKAAAEKLAKLQAKLA